MIASNLITHAASQKLHQDDADAPYVIWSWCGNGVGWGGGSGATKRRRREGQPLF